MIKMLTIRQSHNNRLCALCAYACRSLCLAAVIVVAETQRQSAAKKLLVLVVWLGTLIANCIRNGEKLHTFLLSLF